LTGTLQKLQYYFRFSDSDLNLHCYKYSWFDLCHPSKKITTKFRQKLMNVPWLTSFEILSEEAQLIGNMVITT
jgi:hypothetical protein